MKAKVYKSRLRGYYIYIGKKVGKKLRLRNRQKVDILIAK